MRGPQSLCHSGASQSHVSNLGEKVENLSSVFVHDKQEEFMRAFQSTEVAAMRAFSLPQGAGDRGATEADTAMLPTTLAQHCLSRSILQSGH